MPENENPIIDDAPETGEQIKQKISYKQRFLAFLRFVKKHKLSIFITSVIIAIAIFLFNIIPVIPVSDVKLVNLNAPVRIEKDQTVKLKFEDVSVKVKDFVNDVCPEAGKCFGNGDATLAVEYEYSEYSKKIATGTAKPSKGTKYEIETISTDYETYAEIRIIAR